MVKVTIHSSVARAILSGAEVAADLSRRAENIKNAADSVGSGVYRASVAQVGDRKVAYINTTDVISRNSNAKHNTLLKSLDAGRG